MFLRIMVALMITEQVLETVNRIGKKEKVTGKIAIFIVGITYIYALTLIWSRLGV